MSEPGPLLPECFYRHRDLEALIAQLDAANEPLRRAMAFLYEEWPLFDRAPGRCLRLLRKGAEQSIANLNAVLAEIPAEPVDEYPVRLHIREVTT